MYYLPTKCQSKWWWHIQVRAACDTIYCLWNWEDRWWPPGKSKSKKRSWHLICSRSCNTLKLKVQSSHFTNPEWCYITSVSLLKIPNRGTVTVGPRWRVWGGEWNNYVSGSVCEGPSSWSPTCGVLVQQLPRPKQKPTHDVLSLMISIMVKAWWDAENLCQVPK